MFRDDLHYSDALLDALAGELVGNLSGRVEAEPLPDAETVLHIMSRLFAYGGRRLEEESDSPEPGALAGDREGEVFHFRSDIGPEHVQDPYISESAALQPAMYLSATLFETPDFMASAEADFYAEDVFLI
ncbi:hypothetical protein CCR78_04735 [Rhodovulum imhoffii]|nr:hypothetical protein [Rhodovulum imhoffii]